jgi:hypothetical protein
MRELEQLLAKAREAAEGERRRPEYFDGKLMDFEARRYR